MKSILVTLFATLLTVACDDSDAVSHSNQVNLSGDGELIGVLKDGRKVHRYAVKRVNESTHYIYVVPSGGSVTENYWEAKQSKTTAVIDGGW